MRIDRVAFISAMASQFITQKRLAEISGVSRGTITGIVSGRSCKVETAEKLARALGVPIKSLQEVPEGNAQVAKIEKEAEHAEDTYNQCRVR